MNRLETDWFKLVADADVRPLILTARPAPGENLIGFLSRVMERQAFSSLTAGLSLAGIGCTKPSNIASLLRNADQIRNLATLLSCPVSQIQQLLEPVVTAEGSQTRMTRYCGMAIQSRYRTFDRRVSPRSLASQNVHMARWSLRLFNFDPVTREALLSACPECNTPLCWRRSVGISKCSKCKNADGTPAVDLRDYPQKTIEARDDAAIQFLADLIHHDSGTREAAMVNLGSPWRGLSPTEVFEAVAALAWAKVKLPDLCFRSGRPSKPSQFLSIEPEHLIDASQVLLGGRERLVTYVADALKATSAISSSSGAVVSFGAVGCLGNDPYLAVQVRTVVESALQEVRSDQGIRSRGGPRIGSRGRLIDRAQTIRLPAVKLLPGYTRIGQAAENFGMTHQVFEKLLRGQHMDPFVLKNRRRNVGVDENALRAAFPEIFDSVGPSEAGRMLNIPAFGVKALSTMGILQESVTSKTKVQTYRRYSRQSVADLVTMLASAAHLQPGNGITLRKAMSEARIPFANSAAVVAYVVLHPSKLYGLGSEHADWRDAIGVSDLAHFIREMSLLNSRLAPGGDYMKRREVVYALGCASSTLDALISCGLIKLRDGPTKQMRFRSSEIEAFKKSYVLFDEAASFFSFKGPRQAYVTLSGMGLRPFFHWGSDNPLVFDRPAFEIVKAAFKRTGAP